MNFAALLKKASSNTAQQQAEHAKQERERAEAKKAAEEAERRRQAELRRLADDRRKEREERERKEREEAARKSRAIPKTHNAWALKQERKRLGLDPDGKDDHLLDAAGSTGSSKPKSYKELLSKANSSAKSGSTAGSAKGKAKETEPTVLSRAERAQRKQAALFNDDDEPSSGAFALASSKRSTSAGSSRGSPAASAPSSTLRRAGSNESNQNGRMGSPASGASVRPSTSKSSARPNGSSKTKSTASSAAAAAATSGSARNRLTAQINSFQAPQRLNVVKRDTRTIEEIERDMKLRRAKANGTHSGGAGGKEGAPSNKAALTTTSRVKAEPEAERDGRPAKDRVPQRRPRSPSESPEDSDDYTSSEDERPRKRSRPRAHSSGLREDQRSAIWKLMGRDRNRDLERERALGSDDSDMEATGEDVLREERQAARMAAREDAAELARERKRAEEKAARKLGSTGR